MQITDRAKDVIKSGGSGSARSTWRDTAISLAPAIAEAAAIGVHHPKWDGRSCSWSQARQRRDGAVQAHLAQHVAKWWLPDEVLFVRACRRHGQKLLQTAIREQYTKDFKLAAA